MVLKDLSLFAQNRGEWLELLAKCQWPDPDLAREFFFLIGSSFPFLSHALCIDIYNGKLFLHLATFQCSEHQCFGISLHWENLSLLEQRPLLTLMPDTAMFLYICNWNHSFLNVFSIVSVIVHEGCVEIGCWEHCFPMKLQPLSALSVFTLAPSLGSPSSLW